MRRRKGFFAIAAVVAVVVSTIVGAGALIATTSSVVVRLATAPASVRLNALESATKVYAFDEKQGVALLAPVAVDAVNPGSYTTFPPARPPSRPAGSSTAT